MQITAMFSLLLLQLASLAIASPVAPTRVLAARQSAPTCDLTFTYPTLGSCSTGCCGWGFYNLTESSGWLCQNTGNYDPKPTTYPDPQGFVNACKSLQTEVGEDWFTWWLTSEKPNTWYEAKSNYGCSLQFNFDRAIDNDNDGPHLGNGDLAQMLGEGITATEGGTMDARGYSTCYSYSLQWRMVPK
ncbi:hypothetical protein PG996_004090 [Apiospora saccharicola]|uniref:Ecp2 effector protein domain-containing protein n=1 Tax=Apiospora saccharicola TaxID=335842 RepID=A0ABR1W357_9PEZI